MVRADQLVAERGKSMIIKKQTSIYSSTTRVERVWQCYSRVSVQGLRDKRFAVLAQALVGVIDLNLDKVEGLFILLLSSLP